MATHQDRLDIMTICMVLGLVMLCVSIISIGNAYIYCDYLTNAKAYQAQAIEQRETYIIMLDKLSYLIKQDVTASSTYLEVYDKIINFNKWVMKAKRWGDTWAEGIFCDPRYKGLEVIPLN